MTDIIGFYIEFANAIFRFNGSFVCGGRFSDGAVFRGGFGGGSGTLSEIMKAKARQKDIAKLAGVSQRAVAAVVGKSRSDTKVRVSPATRERIQAVAAELGYHPHRQAQFLRGVRSELIGVIKTVSMVTGASRTSAALVRRVRERGYSVTAHEMLWGTNEMTRAITGMLDFKIEGLIFQGGHRNLEEREYALLREAGVPAVCVTGSRQAGLPYFGSDLEDGMLRIVRHLAGAGHRSVGLLLEERAGSSQTASNWETQLCEKGFRAGARAQGWSDAAAPIFYLPRPGSGLDDLTPAREFTRRLDGASCPDALICFRDSMAIGAIAGLRDSGRRVPGDVAVVGQENSPVGRHMTPALTTLAGDSEGFAAAAVDHLFERIGGEAPENDDRARLFPCELIARESCGCASEVPPVQSK